MVRREGAPARRAPLRDQSGSVLIEAALVIPVVLVVAASVVMAGRVAHARIGVEAVAREAGRALAQAPTAARGLQEGRLRALAAARGCGLDPAAVALQLDAGTFARGGVARARASYRVALGDVPFYGVAGVTVTASHQERVELYRSRARALP